MGTKAAKSLRALLSGIIDYAGLFPPAGLTMAEAVSNYAEYLESSHSWMLGRFILPLGRIEEFEAVSGKGLKNPKKPWRISALANNGVSKTVKQIAEFNAAFEGRAVIDTLETKVEEPAEITAIASTLPEDFPAFFEIPLADKTGESFTRLAVTHQRAKLRTGGVTQDAFPPSDEIAKFIRIALAANVPFKATAGLHHPLRCVKPLTYEEEAPRGLMNGFLNVFLSACFLRLNLNESFVYQLILDGDIANFEFTDEDIAWMGNRVGLGTIELTRKRNAISFGSCSFTEPVDDLKELGLL